MLIPFLKKLLLDFPGGRVDNNPLTSNPLTSAGYTGSIPSLGRSHMLQSNLGWVQQLLNPFAATTEALTSRACAPQ